MKVKIKKLDENAVIPEYAKDGDAGMDLTCVKVENKVDKVVYSTGLAMEIPEGHVGLLFPRSSIHKKALTLANSVGVIDSGYRGEIKFIFRAAIAQEFSQYEPGDRVGQIIIMPYPKIEFEEVEELDETERGDGGFGSTGE
jgi:dUTP pyrophosphatase